MLSVERLPGWARNAPAVGRADACLPLARQAGLAVICQPKPEKLYPACARGAASGATCGCKRATMRSRRMNFCTLPVTVMGNSSTNST